jgi:hypothetical protein
VLLVVFLGVPALAELLGGGWPSPLGRLAAGAGAVVLALVDAAASAREAPAHGRRGTCGAAAQPVNVGSCATRAACTRACAMASGVVANRCRSCASRP